MQPWDAKGFRIPGGDSKSPAVVQMLAIAPVHGQRQGPWQLPGHHAHIMSCLFEGCLLDFDAALAGRVALLRGCVVSQTSKNMIGTLVPAQRHQEGPVAPRGRLWARSKGRHLGAGMMGAGIAYVSAKVGIDVVLLDTTHRERRQGQGLLAGLLDKAMSRGRPRG